MQPTRLAKRITTDFAKYQFAVGDGFVWSPQNNTVFYPVIQSLTDVWSLLHEVSHGELGHNDYTLDIELVRCESQAWDYAVRTLAPRYNLQIDDDYIQDHLDTYREWLHARSTCPECGQNGLQTQNTYGCINCRCLWRANEARLCSLRRIKLPNQSQTS